jgi:pseudouridine-5'-monophosphatase
MLAPILREQTDAVLFDMDGVLLDTEPLYGLAWNRFLAPFGRELTPDLTQKMMGRPALVSADLVIRAFALPLSPEELVLRRAPILRELVRDSPAFPGAERLVQGLKLRGFRVAVATSTSRELYLLKTSSHAWFREFESVVCGDDTEVARPKPAPDIFLVAAKRLGVRPERCVIFEDSPAGLQAAFGTGARVIRVGHQDAVPGAARCQAISGLADALPLLEPASSATLARGG